MRILHLGKYYAPDRGGIERHTQALAGHAVARGDAVAVLVHRQPGAWRSCREEIEGVEVHRAGCLGAPLYTPLSPAFPLQLAHVLRTFGPDLLHLHLPNPSCFAALAMPAARRRPWIVHWHADVPPDAPDWRLRLAYRAYRPFERAMLARAAAIVVTSRSYLDASVALAPWHGKVRVIPLGIADETPVAPAFDAWPRGEGLRVLAVGRLSRYKGFDVLVDALAQQPGTRLLLVGRGDCEASLRARARTRGVEARITFAGELDDDALAAAYAAADVFALPSLDRSEAFGLVLLEAMRAGMPVIASAIPGSGVGEVVQDGLTGLLVPPADVAALAQALSRLGGDAALRARLGAGGRSRWRETFTLERSGAEMHALYREVLDSAGGSST